MTDVPRDTEVFVEHRELLFSIVYSMLGSVADTEDVLQETWLSWSGRTGIENPRAYLEHQQAQRGVLRAVVARAGCVGHL
jgi:DNA-directed RNA polymerase specialized sigma24 family protein